MRRPAIVGEGSVEYIQSWPRGRTLRPQASGICNHGLGSQPPAPSRTPPPYWPPVGAGAALHPRERAPTITYSEVSCLDIVSPDRLSGRWEACAKTSAKTPTKTSADQACP